MSPRTPQGEPPHHQPEKTLPAEKKIIGRASILLDLIVDTLKDELIARQEDPKQMMLFIRQNLHNELKATMSLSIIL